MPAVMTMGTRPTRMTTPTTITRTIVAICMIMASTTTMTTTSTTTITGIITAIPMLMTTNSEVPPAAPVAMTESEVAALYRLMTWLSPSFPVGGFSYSSGIEWAVEAGDISDAASLQDWLAAMLVEGSGFCDGAFLAHAHRAVTDDDAIANEYAK